MGEPAGVTSRLNHGTSQRTRFCPQADACSHHGMAGPIELVTQHRGRNALAERKAGGWPRDKTKAQSSSFSATKEASSSSKNIWQAGS